MMPKLESIKGHTILGATSHLGYYVMYERGADGRRSPEAGTRSLALDVMNLSETGERPWYEQMDSTRHAMGNDVAVRGRAPLTYMQYVISPDPRDDVSLETLRELSCAWARRWFADYEVAIAYHDDNESGVMHAHVIVNNTNLETGRRLGSALTNAFVRRLNQSLQQMAAERGLRAFDESHESRTREEMRRAGTRVNTSPSRERDNDRGRHARGGRSTPTTKTERELRRRGEVPWKDELRDMIDLALAASAGTAEFMDALDALGVGVSESRSGTGKRPDWVFSHPSGGSRRCSGRRLGAAWSRERIESALALGHADLAQAASGGPRPRAPVDAALRRSVVRGIRVLGVARPGSDVTARDVVAMLGVIRETGARGYEDLAAVPGEAARAAERVAREIGAFDPGNRARTRRERDALEVVSEALAARDLRGHGGTESTAQAARAVEAPAPGDERSMGGEEPGHSLGDA